MTDPKPLLSELALAAMRKARRSWPDAMFSCTFDPRFCYALHVPDAIATGAHPGTLLVAVHGSGRDAGKVRNALAPFAEAHHLVVLAPLFPIGVRGDGHADGYKYMLEGDIRYDLVLLAMVEEVAALLEAAFPRFLLFGFSGGGHFVHRMFYLHPQRLAALSVGAPGSVTLIDDRQDWWRGTRNIAARFGTNLDFAAMRSVPVQLVVGAEDTKEFASPPITANQADDLAFGRNRIERMSLLRRSLEDHGMTPHHDIVPGVAHDVLGVLPTVQRFFASVLSVPAPAERQASS